MSDVAVPEEVYARIAGLAREKTPFFADIWARQRQEFGPEWAAETTDAFLKIFGTEGGEAWENALYGYADFAMDAMRSQKRFEEHRRYEPKTAAAAAIEVYDNAEYMAANYLPGLILSHYLWPHHYRLLKFFRNEIAPLVGRPGLFYDVGIGTGLYSLETLARFPGSRGRGVDISEHSIRFTAKVLKAYGFSDRYSFEKADVFKASLPEEDADFLICQEVLEHLEDPRRFCEILLKLTKKGSRAYITAAINAAHTDHIYLFRSPDEAAEVVRAAGWKILASRAEYAYSGKALEITPCVAGFLCQRPS